MAACGFSLYSSMRMSTWNMPDIVDSAPEPPIRM